MVLLAYVFGKCYLKKIYIWYNANSTLPIPTSTPLTDLPFQEKQPFKEDNTNNYNNYGRRPFETKYWIHWYGAYG